MRDEDPNKQHPDTLKNVETTKLDPAEVAKHTTAESCWITLNDTVYDITPLLSHHPGGATPLLSHAGTDATETFHEIHPSDTLPEAISSRLAIPLGPVSTASLPKTPAPSKPADLDLPPLASILSIRTFEQTAQKALSPRAWAYYSSAADDKSSFHANTAVFTHLHLRPRVLRNVRHITTHTRMLATDVSLPLFISPAAQARLGHRDGECGIARAAAKEGVVYCVSNNASMTVEEISAAADTGVLWWQLYVQDDRARSERMLRRIQAPGLRYRAVVLTVDAPVPGKREEDQRVGGVGATLFAGTTAALEWADLEWVRERCGLPLVLKGVQTWEDVVLAARAGCEGVILSNHGGRALDTAPPAVVTLLEVRRYAPWVFERLEVYVDGGVRRGTDVVKCVALGARAVGVGRAALYSLAGYGEEGVGRMLGIMREEVETAVRLLGEVEMSGVQGNTRLVNARRVENWCWEGPGEEEGEGLKAKL